METLRFKKITDSLRKVRAGFRTLTARPHSTGTSRAEKGTRR